MRLLDDNSLPLIMFRLAARWAGIRLETLVTLVSTTTNVLVVLLHGSISPALAGLAIAYSVQVGSIRKRKLSTVEMTQKS